MTLTKEAIRERALELGFGDAGFTTAEPFCSHGEFLTSRSEEYGWAEAVGLALRDGCDPRAALPGAQGVIALLEVYFAQAFPAQLEGSFGRVYLDDDRITRDGLTIRIKAFRGFLRDHGIDSRVPFNLPHRLAAARAGLGTFGKNCLLYANRVARRSSWSVPVAIVVDRAFEPDEPTIRLDCPAWCRNACIAACPTRALKGPGHLDPRLCISYLSYFTTELTPRALREPMGIMVYGCDRCQNVCPRNAPWSAVERAPNERVRARAGDFALSRLLAMDQDTYESRIWPHMFYIPQDQLWRWKMNAARAMGNTLDLGHVADLARALNEEEDERVRAMSSWALGRLGGQAARLALESARPRAQGVVAEEIELALQSATKAI